MESRVAIIVSRIQDPGEAFVVAYLAHDVEPCVLDRDVEEGLAGAVARRDAVSGGTLGITAGRHQGSRVQRPHVWDGNRLSPRSVAWCTWCHHLLGEDDHQDHLCFLVLDDPVVIPRQPWRLPMTPESEVVCSSKFRIITLYACKILIPAAQLFAPLCSMTANYLTN